MSLRTALTIVFSALLTALIFFFVYNNFEILRQPLTVFSISFSVITALVGGMLLASALPSAYFSVQWFKANRRLKHHHKADRTQAKDTAQWRQVAALRAHGQYEKALKLAQSLPLRERPENKVMEANLLLELCRFKDVIDQLENEFQKEPQPEEGYLLAEAYRQAGNEERARMVYETLASNFGEDCKIAYELLLEDALESEDWQSVLSWGRKLGTFSDPDLNDVLVGAEFEHLKSQAEGDMLADRKFLNEVTAFVKAHRTFVPGYLLQSHVLMETGQESKALKVLQSGFEATEHFELLDRMVDFYIKKDQPEDAIGLMKRISVEMNNRLATFELGRLYLRLSMYHEAIEALTPLLRTFRQPFLIYQLLAEAEKGIGNAEHACEFMEKAFTDDKEHRLATYCCAFCGQTTETWTERCDACGSWDTVSLNLEALKEESMETPINYG